MTRINLVDPNLLADQHLIAEYRELPRIFTNVKKAINNNKTIKDFKISSEFCLGTGHVIFFYDKLLFLSNRYKSIITECLNRGFNIQFTNDDFLDGISSEWINNWVPTPNDLIISNNRLDEKIKLKPTFYTYNKQKIYK